MPSVRTIGRGRAGSSLVRALVAAGWTDAGSFGRDDDVSGAAGGDVDLLVIATPDAAVRDVAAAVTPAASCVVAHLAGSLGLDVLMAAGHRRVAAIHPLRAIPTGDTPLAGAWIAVAGDPLVGDVVAAIGGRAIEVADADRVAYHAAAVVASNHLVALLGQVERIAATAGVPLDAFFDLVRGTVDNVERLGPRDALTGPVTRGDWDTVARHLAALDPSEREAYIALAHGAARLVDREVPELCG